MSLTLNAATKFLTVKKPRTQSEYFLFDFTPYLVDSAHKATMLT